MKRFLALLFTFLISTPVFAQGFGSPNGVGFPTNGSSGGGGLTSPVGISDGGTGQTTKAAAFNALSPLTTQSDILYGGASGAGTRLAKGTALQILRMNSGATAPEWATPAWATGDGGTGLSSFTGGDTLYYASGTALSKLAKGTALQYYRMNAGATAPEWATAPWLTNPLTTTGDTIYSSSGTTGARLGIGKYDQTYRPSLSGVPEWADRPVAPSVTTSELRTPWFARVAVTSATTLTYAGATALSVNGTPTSTTGTDGSWINNASAATANSDASFGSGVQGRLDAKQRVWARIKLVDTTVLRFRFTLGTVTNDADYKTNSVGFIYNPATHVNGNIYFYTNDGTTTNAIDTGVPFAAGIYNLCIDGSNTSSYKGYINGNLVATSATNLPTTTSSGYLLCLRTLENVAKNFMVGGLYGDNI